MASSLPQSQQDDGVDRLLTIVLDDNRPIAYDGVSAWSPHSIDVRARHRPPDRHEMERWDESLPSSSTSTCTTRHSTKRTERAKSMPRVRSALVSLGLLSLLPVQAGARPAGRDGARAPARSSSSTSSSPSIQSPIQRNARNPDGYIIHAKRDRRRSTERRLADVPEGMDERGVRRGSERHLDGADGKQPENQATPRWTTRKPPTPSFISPASPPSSFPSSGSRPTPAPPLLTQYRKDGIPPAEPTSTPTPTTEATFRRITVPNTILPYLFTTDSDGQLGTANWELYGRVAQDPSIIGRAEEEMTTTITTSLLDPTEPETTASTSTAGSMATQVAAADADGMDTTFLITDALPRGWGIESDRGDLYAVPLITVASVCLAALIFCFIVITVVSRAKAKRRRARRERRKAQLIKNERARQAAAERADPADGPGNDVMAREGMRDEESSLGDEENGIGDIIRSERVAGQADQQRSNGGRYSAADSDAERDDVLEQKFKVAGQGNRAKVRRVVSVGVTRLGNGRILEWRKGLRKRKTASNVPAAADPRDLPVQPILIDRRDAANRSGVGRRSSTSLAEGSGEGSSTTAVESDARIRGGDTVSLHDGPDGTVSPASTLPADLPLTRTISRALTRTSESGDRAHQDVPTDAAESQTASIGNVATPGANQASVTFAAPHFPPAYYRAAGAPGTVPPAATGSQNAVDDLPQHGETLGSTSVEGGPATISARAAEKRPANYYPAPTTADQEDAVAVAFGHGGAGRSVGTEDVSASRPPDIRAPHLTVGDTAVIGHLATDDKGVLEQLRNAGSMPSPTGDALAAESPSVEQLHGRDATAPAVDVDEEGFERLDMNYRPETSSMGTDGQEASITFPIPPRPVVQSSYMAAPEMPSAPSFGEDSGGSAPGQASAPFIEDVTAGTGPSAPLAEDDLAQVEEASGQQEPSDHPGPSAPPVASTERDHEGASSASVAPAQPTPAARASHARRSLGLDLPVEDSGAAPPLVDEHTAAPTTRFLPRYEP